MTDLVQKITRMLSESESGRMIRWIKTWGENHGVMPDEEGFFDKCVASMSDNLGEDGAKKYCARAKDTWEKSTYWRGKGKSEKEVAKDTKEHPNYPKSKRKKAEIDKAKEE